MQMPFTFWFVATFRANKTDFKDQHMCSCYLLVLLLFPMTLPLFFSVHTALFVLLSPVAGISQGVS